MLKKHDILAIQEHWLFNFQLQDLEKTFCSHFVHSKAVDDDNPLPPTQKPRGYGGVALFYSKDLNYTVKKLTTGCSRIVAVEVLTTPPLCICSVYMPSRNSKTNYSDKENYQQCLDQLEEIMDTFGGTHAMLILGDMNASLCKRQGNNQDVLLENFVKSNNLFCEQNGSETFFHPNKSDKAEIDYILFNDKCKQYLGNVTVDNRLSSNTSDHIPVVGTLFIQNRKTTNQKTKVVCKPKWDRCDKSAYRKMVRENLLSFDTFLPSTTGDFDILQPLSHLNAVLKRATTCSIPKHKSEVTVRQLQSRPWSESIHDAIKESRLAWWDWKKSGSPSDPTHATVQRKKIARKLVRKEQRQEAAKRRKDKIEEIMRSRNEPKTFYKLIGNQRKSSNSQLHSLVVDGKECETQDHIREGWATHFQHLATPMENPKFDQEYKQMVNADVEAIEILCKEESSRMEPVSEEEVSRALKRLNNNKAVDIMGLTSEHFKLAGREILEFLTSLLNYIIMTKSISVVLKEGILTPIFKKGDPSNPSNYRGITVTPVYLKILEHIINTRHNLIFHESQSRLQKGFTAGCSSLNAALILSECILEAGNNKRDLFVTTLDTQKAFDVVDQNSLLRKLYLDGIHGDDWLLLRDLYSDCSSRIKWAGELSHPINIMQGVRQGGVLSTSHYKRYNNPLLLQLEDRYSGTRIGSISIPHVTVADDLALISESKSDAQVMIWDADNSAGRERYCIHPTKSHILWYTKRKKNDTELGIVMAGEKVDTPSSTVHLGIVRNTSGQVDVEGKISLGRKTAYSLMGAGLHGGSGLKATLNGHIWSTFVIPRFLYGLEVQILKSSDIESLEKFQRKCLKQIQGLPDNTSNTACLALLGVLPIEALLHKNLLNMFVNMIRNENSVEYEIAKRQLVMKDTPRESIFTHIQSILDRYDLPSVFDLLNCPPTKEAWKSTLNHKINDMVQKFWRSDIESKSSTKYLNPNVLCVGSSHHIWSTVRNNIHDSRRAQIKCKLLTGTYILQANRAAFNQYAINPTCKLCNTAPETRQHFVGECAFFKEERKLYIEKLKTSPILSDQYIQSLCNPEFLTQLTLDATVIPGLKECDSEGLGSLELCTREYIHKIHVRRIVALKRIS